LLELGYSALCSTSAVANDFEVGGWFRKVVVVLGIAFGALIYLGGVLALSLYALGIAGLDKNEVRVSSETSGRHCNV
jgi:hypothetical protein